MNPTVFLLAGIRSVSKYFLSLARRGGVPSGAAESIVPVREMHAYSSYPRQFFRKLLKS
jgi:hypothetical protein